MTVRRTCFLLPTLSSRKHINILCLTDLYPVYGLPKLLYTFSLVQSQLSPHNFSISLVVSFLPVYYFTYGVILFSILLHSKVSYFSFYFKIDIKPQSY
jgi:hypothetical protein